MTQTFQRGKPEEEPQPFSEEGGIETLPELSNSIYRERLIKAYRRIESEYQRRQQNILRGKFTSRFGLPTDDNIVQYF